MDKELTHSVVNNFTEANKLEIIPAIYADTKLIHLCQRGESMSFQFSMNIEQAKEMGMALITRANELENHE